MYMSFTAWIYYVNRRKRQRNKNSNSYYDNFISVKLSIQLSTDGLSVALGAVFLFRFFDTYAVVPIWCWIQKSRIVNS